MSSQERPLFDLNELPAEYCEDDDVFVHFQNSKLKRESPKNVNPNTFCHSSSLSVFQPFIKPKDVSSSEDSVSEPSGIHDSKPQTCSLLKSEDLEREDGECFDANGVASSSGLDPDLCNLENNSVVMESESVIKKEIKGDEAKYGLKCGNIIGKRQRFDDQNVTMLGKKRNRQVVLLKLEDVKNIKSSTTRKKNLALPKEIPSPSKPYCENEKKSEPVVKDKKDHILCSNGETHKGTEESKSGYNGGRKDLRSMVWRWKSEFSTTKSPLGSQSSMDAKHVTKKIDLSKKPSTAASSQYQDTSIERLLREVTNEKFWNNPESSELQRVPGRFESMDEYIRVFEPLLFEECRAQLYSTWEELTETVSKDHHIMIRVKTVERRDRGWCDAIVLPAHESLFKFKEGEVAILSSPRPGSVRSKRGAPVEVEEEKEVIGRVVGTVRRLLPVDKSDSPGAIFHFYAGESYDSYSKDDNAHILNKLQPKGVWYLTVLGPLATTQREYIALHASRRINSQMQNAILHPSPDHFPKYELQPPAMPKCFTQNFTHHLKKSFNGPQLASIQWAAMHTSSKNQDPWPFTLVQGPPGTGKTHTVWGMLNVIHLVQYQHYYSALLKKLAPEIYNQAHQTLTSHPHSSSHSGSIGQVLQNMDQNLLRTLPKLCPKPRMLVCAPSNAAIDELLTRVLDRGFIDGEMKIYRPDVARVGVDVLSRAAQAVSVERRTEQLLRMDRGSTSLHMKNCRNRELKLSREITALQYELSLMAGDQNRDPSYRDPLLQRLAAVVESRDKNLVDLSRFLTLEKRFVGGDRFHDETRGILEASFTNEAEIVFTTVSSSGRRLFNHLSHGFDMVVIDEAAQASEVSVLPPLSLDAARCVLVGDPNQLPATVISKAAGSLLYSRSLFERFQQAGCPTIFLSVQYRMHPQIRDFPSRYFYKEKLTDSETVSGLPDDIFHEDPLLRPYLFYDVRYGRESHRDGSVSFQNVYEARFCLELYERLRRKGAECRDVSVGIITPYKLQLKCLRNEFAEVLKAEEGKNVVINTVDAFQGQERDVVIMSCVRASSHGVGFVADIRRMNVALTRARRALWVMGNANALNQSDDWAALINDAKARNCYMDMESLPQDFIVSKETSPRFPGFLGPRSSGPKHRSLGSGSRSLTPSEDDLRSSAPPLISMTLNSQSLKKPE